MNVHIGSNVFDDEIVEIRHRIHQHPELGFEELRTSDLVAERLAAWGYEVHRGLGKTGVVGTLKAGSGTRSIGIRADMDALPIQETTGLPYASRRPNTMHACGHDGHTAMLLGAAKQIAESRKFNGTVHLIFQPAEEGQGGAVQMMKDGLFRLFPCNAIFAMHNMPGFPEGKLVFRAGPFMASADRAEIVIKGVGGHGAFPQKTIDPVVVAASIVMALQSIVARNIDPQDPAVVTVGAIKAGDAPNVIPPDATMSLSIRALDPAVRKSLRSRITALAKAQAESYGATAIVNYREGFPVLVNTEKETAFAAQVAKELVGEENVILDPRPLMGSEDFACMLEELPGCYLLIGNGDGEGNCMVHNPGFDFNDRCIPIGSAYWTRLVERFLS
ncbi:MAG TPA: M20 aminoacylase family protein [Alphaproteobacteria bacterium]|nr:M20 aminoacylase family protein [Alphaproteobacteria bacterium]